MVGESLINSRPRSIFFWGGGSLGPDGDEEKDC